MVRIPIIGLLLIIAFALSGQVAGDSVFIQIERTFLKQLERSEGKKNLEFAESKQNFESMLAQFDCYQRGRIYHLLGLSSYEMNDETMAIHFFKKAALDSWKNCAKVSKAEIANTIYNIGISYQYSEEIQRGQFYLDTSIYLVEQIDGYPKQELARKYEGAGYYFIESNDYYRAKKYLNRAVSLAEHIDPYTLLDIRINQIILFNKYKKYERAIEVLKHTDSLFVAYESAYDEHTKVVYLLNAASLYFYLEKYDACKSYIDRAKNKLPEDENSLISNIYEIEGNFYIKKNNISEARNSFNKAYRNRLHGNTGEQDKLGESIALHNLSDVEFRDDNYKEALKLIDRAIEILAFEMDFDDKNNPILNNRYISFPLYFVEHLQLKYKILEKIKGEELTRLSLVTKIDTIITKSLKVLSFEKSKLELLPLIQVQTEEAIRVCLALHKSTKDPLYLEQAFYFSSQAKSFILQQELQAKNYLSETLDPALMQEINTLRTSIATIQSQRMISDSDSLITQLNENERTLQKRLKSINTKVDRWTTKTYTCEMLQEQISSDQVVLDMYQGKDSVFFFWITKDAFLIEQVPTDSLVPLIDSIGYYNSNPEIVFNSKHAHDGYQMIFTNKVQEILPPNYTLKVIPEGKLYELNFETLIQSNGQFMVWDVPISYAYHPAFMFPKKTIEFEKSFLGFGTKYTGSLDQDLRRIHFIEMDQSIGKLQSSEEEIVIANQFMHGDLYLGKDAQLKSFMSEASKYAIIYLSLHGIVDVEDGVRTGVIFHNDGDDFVLGEHAIDEMNLESKLIVLSSCHSANGKSYKGEGLKGMTRSFFASGVQHVLSSLWTAAERPSLEILPLFLKDYTQNNPMDVSLQQSKIKYLSNVSPMLQHPYYWGNYVLYGALAEEKTDVKWKVWLGLISILFLGSVLFFKYKKSA